MKVLQINVVYREGSTGSIVYNVHNFLKSKGINSLVCHGRGNTHRENNVYKIISETAAKTNVLLNRFTGFQYGGCYISLFRLIKIICREKPDIIHLHCINGGMVNIYALLNWLKSKGLKTIVTLHAEFFFTGSCGHAYECEKWRYGCGDCPRLWEAAKSYLFDTTRFAWLKMKKSFAGFGDNLVVVSVSPWLAKRAKQSAILKELRHYVVKNGVDTNVFSPHENTDDLRKKHNLGDEKIILHVTASFKPEDFSQKGGGYIIALSELLKEENIKILVVGSRKTDFKLPSNIINVGRVKDQRQLAEYYSMADLCIIVSKRETFSMVCAESLCCGTPVTGFKAGGPESISLTDYSEFVEYGDVAQLSKAILKRINFKTEKTVRVISKQAKTEYDVEKMCKEYLGIYNSFNNVSKGK